MESPQPLWPFTVLTTACTTWCLCTRKDAHEARRSQPLPLWGFFSFRSPNLWSWENMASTGAWLFRNPSQPAGARGLPTTNFWPQRAKQCRGPHLLLCCARTTVWPDSGFQLELRHYDILAHHMQGEMLLETVSRAAVTKGTS